MEWARNNRHYAKERQAIGEIASPDDVRKVVYKAAECSDIRAPNANWDVAVNSRVLDMALERADGYPCLVNSMWASKASIRDEYNKCEGEKNNFCDFCVYLVSPLIYLMTRPYPTLIAFVVTLR
ncbi:hypothetical protein BGZ61DRAFT_540761 [Ilyonectria robusta]|uniref:uncharacterized protein n=1 Tax=Ilyonectria robusta TaxID=1079257 RepID=UPI001E8E8160|nr:uncharacterized protein BGZ61DRAFT_540761 [Ilyonectria robusta]KAH8656785.1 hypothetical protein BGZ61DRAFT_540761 [Ilyonectria robusta]